MVSGQCANCTTQVTGTPRSCSLIEAGGGSVTAMKMTAAFPALDLDATAGDGAVTIEAVCQ
jgi:hypothetical protein